MTEQHQIIAQILSDLGLTDIGERVAKLERLVEDRLRASPPSASPPVSDMADPLAREFRG